MKNKQTFFFFYPPLSPPFPSPPPPRKKNNDFGSTPSAAHPTRSCCSPSPSRPTTRTSLPPPTSRPPAATAPSSITYGAYPQFPFAGWAERRSRVRRGRSRTSSRRCRGATGAANVYVRLHSKVGLQSRSNLANCRASSPKSARRRDRATHARRATASGLLTAGLTLLGLRTPGTQS